MINQQKNNLVVKHSLGILKNKQAYKKGFVKQLKLTIFLRNHFIKTGQASSNIIKFRLKEKSNYLSEIELTNLFMGLIKLVKKSAYHEMENACNNEIKRLQTKLVKANDLVEQKNKQINELILVIDDLLGEQTKLNKQKLNKLNKKMKAEF